MYCLPEARGCGVAHKLMDEALKYAEKYYQRCYLETLENMKAAQRFYEKYGFQRTKEAVVKTEHFACDVRYIKEFSKKVKQDRIILRGYCLFCLEGKIYLAKKNGIVLEEATNTMSAKAAAKNSNTFGKQKF